MQHHSRTEDSKVNSSTWLTYNGTPKSTHITFQIFVSGIVVADAPRECDDIALRFPWPAELLTIRAEPMLQTNPHADAASIFESGRCREPRNANLYTCAARAFFVAERYAEAVVFCERALKVDRDFRSCLPTNGLE